MSQSDFACPGCDRAFGDCAEDCPDAAAIAQDEAELLAEMDAARARCAEIGHEPVVARDYWSRDAWTACDRCGVDLDDDYQPPSCAFPALPSWSPALGLLLVLLAGAPIAGCGVMPIDCADLCERECDVDPEACESGCEAECDARRPREEVRC